jgi:hypothetical protein
MERMAVERVALAEQRERAIVGQGWCVGQLGHPVAEDALAPERGLSHRLFQLLGIQALDIPQAASLQATE